MWTTLGSFPEGPYLFVAREVRSDVLIWELRKMDYLSEDLEYFVEKFGTPLRSAPIAAAELEGLSGRLPDGYIAFLRMHGASVWHGGYFQLLGPSRFDPLVELVFARDRDIRPDETTAVACSAVGDLILWNTRHRAIKASFVWNTVRAQELLKPEPDIDPAISFGTMLSALNSDAYGGVDERGELMFPQLVQDYGPPGRGQIYAPRLHPALGGSLTIENFRPASAFEALAIAAQAAPFNLVDTRSFPPKIVRPVGDG